MISIDYRQVGITSGVVLFTFLSNKDLLHKFVEKLNKEDFIATVKFLILAAIIYPLLPDNSYMGIVMLNPVSISSANKFGLLFLVIILLADFMKKNFGDVGVLVLAAISGPLPLFCKSYSRLE